MAKYKVVPAAISNDKKREEFEAWFKSNTNNNGGVAFYVGINGKYCFTDIEMAWQSWQASRAALSIELPESYPRHRDSYIDVMDAELVVEAIESAGVRVKP